MVRVGEGLYLRIFSVILRNLATVGHRDTAYKKINNEMFIV